MFKVKHIGVCDVDKEANVIGKIVAADEAILINEVIEVHEAILIDKDAFDKVVEAEGHD